MGEVRLSDHTLLAPVTPVEIDFNDDDINFTIDIRALAPTTPVEAGFEDSL